MILAGRKHQFDRIAQSVDERMNLGRQSAARSADRLRAVFFRAPALCWRARRIEASIIMYSLSASLANDLKRRSKTPLFAHRLKRWYTMFQSPKRAGKSRQGTPVRYLYRTASTNSRLSAALPPT